MGHDAEEWRTLRREFVEAAAKYDEYETFIERDERREDFYCNNGRYCPLGLIKWPYRPNRKCWILAANSGTDAEPFSVMKTLFNKAWLWLPRDISEGVLETAEMHLSPPADLGLYWAKSHYQHWCWLLWFHWLGQPTEVTKPSQTIVLAPFDCSADLIAQWGLDGSDGKIPESLSTPTVHAVPQSKTAGKRSTAKGEGEAKLKSTLTAHHRYADGGCLNFVPVNSNKLAKLADVAPSTANSFFNKWFGSAKEAKDGYSNYRVACNVKGKLIAILKVMNNEQPRPGEVLFGRQVPDAAENPDHRGGRRRKPRASELYRDDEK